MKVENLTKHICDVCGKIEYTNAGESSIMQEIRLPMKYYSETGRNQGMTNQKIDICTECFKTLADDLSNRYDMRCIAHVGVEIKRHPTEKGGVQE